VVTILFGIVQVGLGFVLGFVNQWHHGHKRHAVSKLFSLIALISGTMAVSGAFFSAFSGTVTLAATVVAIASLVGIIASNPSEATEITSLITHPLSYSRVMGFGLASVIIGFLIDKAFLPNLGLGIPLFIVYLIIFFVLHFLNMILGIFEGAVQSARLNFVEFYTKFYTGGGVKFTPFSYKRIHTKE
jgi:V/A-type H+-transporting ATPase subunit I